MGRKSKGISEKRAQKGAPQLIDAKGPNVYARNGSAVAPTENVAQQEQNVKPKSSRELETVEELKKQNELLKKQVDYWHGQTAEQ